MIYIEKIFPLMSLYIEAYYKKKSFPKGVCLIQVYPCSIAGKEHEKNMNMKRTWICNWFKPKFLDDQQIRKLRKIRTMCFTVNYILRTLQNDIIIIMMMMMILMMMMMIIIMIIIIIMTIIMMIFFNNRTTFFKSPQKNPIYNSSPISLS